MAGSGRAPHQPALSTGGAALRHGTPAAAARSAPAAPTVIPAAALGPTGSQAAPAQGSALPAPRARTRPGRRKAAAHKFVQRPGSGSERRDPSGCVTRWVTMQMLKRADAAAAGGGRQMWAAAAMRLLLQSLCPLWLCWGTTAPAMLLSPGGLVHAPGRAQRTTTASRRCRGCCLLPTAGGACRAGPALAAFLPRPRHSVCGTL